MNTESSKAKAIITIVTSTLSIILIVGAIVLIMTVYNSHAHDFEASTPSVNSNADNASLVCVEQNDGFSIMVDKDTKVQYIHHLTICNTNVSESLTVRTNPDGTPMLYDKEL